MKRKKGKKGQENQGSVRKYKLNHAFCLFRYLWLQWYLPKQYHHDNITNQMDQTKNVRKVVENLDAVKIHSKCKQKKEIYSNHGN